MKKYGLLLAALMTLTFSAAAQADLQTGDTGEDVRSLQQMLYDTGWLQGEPDGVYGEMTAIAVRDFQEYAGLEGTGVADESMMPYLEKEAGKETSADVVIPAENTETTEAEENGEAAEPAAAAETTEVASAPETGAAAAAGETAEPAAAAGTGETAEPAAAAETGETAETAAAPEAEAAAEGNETAAEEETEAPQAAAAAADPSAQTTEKPWVSVTANASGDASEESAPDQCMIILDEGNLRRIYCSEHRELLREDTRLEGDADAVKELNTLWEQAIDKLYEELAAEAESEEKKKDVAYAQEVWKEYIAQQRTTLSDIWPEDPKGVEEQILLMQKEQTASLCAQRAVQSAEEAGAEALTEQETETV